MSLIKDEDILFEDNHLLVLNKAKDLLTQPTKLQADSLESRAKHYLKTKYKKPGNVFAHAAHRLDKPVSGIVVFAKTSKALARLNASMQKGLWQKTYHAKTDAPIEPRAGTMTDFLFHDEFHAKVVDAKAPGAKKATLHYKTLEDGTIQIQLITGRYHQIRAQFASRASPIQGDRKYGAKVRTHKGIMLSHTSLTLPHPVTTTPKELHLTIQT